MNVDINRVKHVYNGRDGKCCCGCAGKHTYTALSAQAEEQTSGFRPRHVNDRTVTNVIRKIQDSSNQEVDFNYGTCVGTVIGTRIYIAYYAP